MLKAGERKGLIVGIDSGTTTAVALLDLKGVLVGLKSQKHFLKKDLQEFIQQSGQPVLVATDVVKIPEIVSKIAAGFNVKINPVVKNLKRKEKFFIVDSFLDKYGKKAENKHEVDALSAAIVCYNKHENKFRQIERQLIEKGNAHRIEEIKEKAIKGISVDRALAGRM